MLKKALIIEISQADPRIAPTEIARRIGANRQYVQQVRAACGFVTPLPHGMRRIDLILKVMAENPGFGHRRVSQVTGIDRRDIQRLLSRYRKENHVALTGAPTPDQSGLQASV